MSELRNGLEPKPVGFVLGLDVGSSVIRCHVYDRTARVCGSSAQKVTGARVLGHLGSGRAQVPRRLRPAPFPPGRVENIYPQAGWVEIDPDVLWTQFVTVIKDAVKAAGIQMSQVIGLGISTQRATFITWNRKTGKHFHNFISWQDQRGIELVKSCNNSLMMKE